MQSTCEQVVMDGVEEVRSGRGRVGLVRGRERQISDGRDQRKKEKGKAMEEKVSMKAKEEELEAKEHNWSRTW